MPWSTRFAEPIPVPKGKPLVTLKDAADYITKLSRRPVGWLDRILELRRRRDIVLLLF